jgi:transcriptional regulator with XRE-family HTH domain
MRRWHTGKTVAATAKSRHVPITELAERMGISRALIYQLFERERWPQEYLTSVAAELGVDASFLAGGSGVSEGPLSTVLQLIDASEEEHQRAYALLRQQIRELLAEVQSQGGETATKPKKRKRS